MEFLQKRPFTTVTFDQKTKIIGGGQPKSELKIDTLSKGQKTFTRHFRPHLYETAPWLCGCSQLNKLLCWPCIFFSKVKTTWTTSGYDDLHNFYKSEKRH
jgi:hypothetical protein